ncbi:hypothetical protein ARMA_2989 [Ardenticatena maritima]|uniref:Uncharacterized protein n=1 Tax=Ardenticatena maritima TaxID=872965 RepID=A0A0M8KC41_9CHLR|nr:hypothetical protein ARMA_2989 [Ardenticatena maritima]
MGIETTTLAHIFEGEGCPQVYSLLAKSKHLCQTLYIPSAEKRQNAHGMIDLLPTFLYSQQMNKRPEKRESR